jgi:RimJ/RimL family protein N-acetyltransferase
MTFLRPPSVSSPRIDYVPTRLDILTAELADPQSIAPLLGARVPAEWPPGLYDRDAIEFFVTRYQEEGDAAVGWYGYHCISTIEGERVLVAAVGYFGPPEGDTTEIGYSVVPAYCGRGFAKECASALASAALRLSTINAVIAHAHKDNVASHRVLLGAGFSADGTRDEDLRFRRAR